MLPTTHEKYAAATTARSTRVESRPLGKATTRCIATAMPHVSMRTPSVKGSGASHERCDARKRNPSAVIKAPVRFSGRFTHAMSPATIQITPIGISTRGATRSGWGASKLTRTAATTVARATSASTRGRRRLMPGRP